MMTRQSMARVSSASTEADFAPGLVPFDWEAAPGRAARKSIKSAFARNIAATEKEIEVPTLPLPPGRRAKDGFYLPHSRFPVESPDMQNEVQLESSETSPQKRRLFNLKFPGTSKKLSSTGRMRLPFQSSSKPPKSREDSLVEKDQCFSIYNPLSGHRFGSSITRRMLVEFQKKQSLWRRCLHTKPGSEHQRTGSSSRINHSKGRRLDSVDEGNVVATNSSASGPGSEDQGRVCSPQMDQNKGRRLDSVDEGYITATSSPVSGPSLPSSPRHGHRPSCISSPVVTRQLQVPSSRFMASMLISLCPADADGSEEAQVDGGGEITADYNGEIRIPHSPMSRPRSSSPEEFFKTPAEAPEYVAIVADPASQTVRSHDHCRCCCAHPAHMSAKEDSSTPQVSETTKMSRSVSRSLYDELATAGLTSELVQQRSLGLEDSASKFNRSSVVDPKGNADAYPVFFKASPTKEIMGRRASSNSSLSWKSDKNRSRRNQEPVTDSVNNSQELGGSEFEKEIFGDDGEKFERRGGNRSLARNFSTGTRNISLSPELNSPHKLAWPRPNSRSTSNRKEDVPVLQSESGAAHRMVGYLSPPRSRRRDLEYITSSSSDKPKAFARWRSTAEPPFQRNTSLVERSELNHPPANRATPKLQHPPSQQALQQNTTPSEAKIKYNKKALNGKHWSTSQRRTPSICHATANIDTDESDEDFDSSTDSSDYETPRAFSSPVISNLSSPKPASLVSSEKLLKSTSPLLKFHRQQNHRESPLSSFTGDHETALPGPSFQQVVLARSHSVRSSASRGFTPHECHTVSADTNFKGPILSPPTRRLANASSSSVMSKVAQWESKAGVGSSGKSLPLYRTMRTSSSAGVTGNSAAR